MFVFLVCKATANVAFVIGGAPYFDKWTAERTGAALVVARLLLPR
jgi:hypothetical protein